MKNETKFTDGIPEAIALFVSGAKWATVLFFLTWSIAQILAIFWREWSK